MLNENRYGLVTGSRCSPLVPVKSAEVGMMTLASELAREKYFKFFESASTWQTEHGTENELLAFQHFKDHIDKDIVQGRWIQLGETGGSTDAEGVGYGVDFKCPTTLQGWLDSMTEKTSISYYNQCQM